MNQTPKKPKDLNEIRLSEPFLETFVEMAKHLAPKHLSRVDPTKRKGYLIKNIIKSNSEDIISLWNIFTSDRKELSRYLMDPKRQLLSYYLGFHLANNARLMGSLQRAFPKEGLKHLKNALHNKKVRIIDFGCGSGSFSQTMFRFLKEQKLGLQNYTIELIDNKKIYVDCAIKGLVELGCEEENILGLRQGIDVWLKKFQKALLNSEEDEVLILGFGYIYNELAQNEFVKEKLLRFLHEINLKQKEAIICFLEPANQNICIEAMELRNILTSLEYKVAYPCPSSEACPMLDGENRDWCYSEFSWKQPFEMQFLDKILKIDRSKIKSASFVFTSNAMSELLLNKRDNVITGRPTDKSRSFNKKLNILGTYQYLVCTEGKLSKVKPKPRSKVLLRGETLSEGNSK